MAQQDRVVRVVSPQVVVDQDGIELPGAVSGSFDVYFDDRHVWSFTRADARGRVRSVPWPKLMRPWLQGVTQVVVRQSGGAPLASAEVHFGDSLQRLSMVDGDGVPVMIDKWGLIQRPFSGRGEGVVDELVDITEKTLQILSDECGIDAWIAFGSLLGAAREGGVIAHDSDVDLAFLSRSATPAEVNREMFHISRALRRGGLRVVNKSAGFVTVVFKAPDGAQGSLDVYSCFYVDDLLHMTATVRERVPRSAIEPVGRVSFEGRQLPAPAEPDTMLAVSYGEGWRVPDPSFQHRPGPEVTERFTDWQGSLMTARRAWERVHREEPRALLNTPTDFGAWVDARIPRDAHVIDLGSGTGRDVLHHARAGRRATGLDYSRGVFAPARRVARDEGLCADFLAVNFADRRDVLSAAALLSRTCAEPRVVTAAGLLDSLLPSDRENVWPLIRVLMRKGGTVLLEFAHHVGKRSGVPGRSAPRHPVSVDEVVEAVRAIGGQVVLVDKGAVGEDMSCTRVLAQW